MEIVETFVDAFSGITSGLGSTIVSTFDSVMVTQDGKLTNIAIWGLTFAGVAGGIKLITWLRSLAA